jgi:hypothetical protein
MRLIGKKAESERARRGPRDRKAYHGIDRDHTRSRNQKPGTAKFESEKYMPKSEENSDGFTEEEQELWRTTVKNSDDMSRVWRIRNDRRQNRRRIELSE